MDTKQWLTKFLIPTKLSFIMPLASIGGIVLGLAALYFADGDTSTIAFGCVFSLLGAWNLYDSRKESRRAKAWIASMEQQGLLQPVLLDFRDASDFLAGELRLGNNWVFGKGCTIPVPYGQFVRIYQHVHKTNFSEDHRTLNAVLTDGKTKVLCDLPLHNKGEEELNRALNAIYAKNPSIQFGYQK